MHIEKVLICGFKRFIQQEVVLNPGLTVIVGDNESGKTTILQAIDLCLSGLYNGRYIKNEISEALFNSAQVDAFLKSLGTEKKLPPPSIHIEVHFKGDDLAEFEGDKNFSGENSCGVSVDICLDERNDDLFREWVVAADFSSLPIELYHIVWESFSRDRDITLRHVPIKSAYIDSTNMRYANGSDIYVTKIIRDLLDKKELVEITKAQRKANDSFSLDPAIKTINQKINTECRISKKQVEIDVEQLTTSAWESGLFTYLDGIPLTNVGKGEQSIVKTKIALAHKKTKEKNVLLIEEPENHLSHARLNELLHDIFSERENRQIVVTTHSSFVANKLGLKTLQLLGAGGITNLSSLSVETQNFFEKVSGYDTLRLILCKRAILVEGDSDELIVQKAYMKMNSGRLPIHDGVDVISVGLSFRRFLEIASKVGTLVCVVTDNDGHPEAVKKRLGEYESTKIKICYDSVVDSGKFVLDGRAFNYNTLEPKMVKCNSRETFNSILGTDFEKDEDLFTYLNHNKSEWALRFFETDKEFVVPDYILLAL